MQVNHWNRHLKGAIARIPLRVFLVVPFLLQLSTIVGLVGYLSFRSGQEAVQDMAEQLIHKVSEQVRDRLDHYLQTPQKLIALNLLAIEQGTLNLENVSEIQQRLWQEVKIYEDINSLKLLNTQGIIVGVGRDKDGRISAPNSIILASGNEKERNYYLASETGKPTQLIQSLKMDNRDRPWYQQGIKQPPNTQAWTPIAPWTGVDWASMNAIAPIYSKGELWGVFGANVILSHISLFLSEMSFSPHGQIFIMEKTGDIVATSTKEKPYVKNIKGQKLIRLPAVKSRDWLTRTTAQEVIKQTKNLAQIRKGECLEFFAKPPDQKFWQLPQRYFMEVFSYQDDYGLDWLIVITIPESDIMGKIYQNVRDTLILVSLALTAAILLGIYTSQWISQPILRLRNSAQAIAQGNFECDLPPVLVKEMQQLTDTFVYMGDRLHQSFQEMNHLNQQLSESQARLEKFLEAIPVGVAIHNAKGSLVYMNQAAKQLLNSEIRADADISEQVIAYQLYLADTDILYPLENLPVVKALKGEIVKTEDIEIHANHQIIAIEAEATPFFDAQGNITHSIVVFQDITARKSAEKLMENYQSELENKIIEKTKYLQAEIEERLKIETVLRDNQIRFQSLSDAAPGVIYSSVQRGNGSIEFEYVSRGIESIFEATVAEILVDPLRFILGEMHEEDRQGYLKALATSAKTLDLFFYEWRIITPSGQLKWLQANSRPELRKNGDICWHGILLDISDRKQMENDLRIANQQLEQLAQTDGLTQLANRRYFDRYLSQEWEKARQEQQPISLILLDIDYFKKFNDSYGHQAGDDCLKQVAQGLQRSIRRTTDLVARYGGEEFVVVLPNTQQPGAVAIAQRIQAQARSLSIPHQASDISDIVTVSMGICTTIPAGESPEALVKQADVALYRAKQQGRDRYQDMVGA